MAMRMLRLLLLVVRTNSMLACVAHLAADNVIRFCFCRCCIAATFYMKAL